MGWKNIYRRRLRVFTVALVIYLDYKAVQRRARWVSRGKEDALWEKTHERNARRLLNLIIELEGLWVKMGQYLSTRADVLPEAYICLLKQLQDSLPPRPLWEVRQTIVEELGKSVDELFSSFFEQPLATASIAQVHRATLKNGEEVVVKVQHDGIKEIILEDLKNAKAIVDWIAWAEPQYDFSPMIDEWCKEAPKELDFNHEAENTRKVSRNLGCRSGNDGTSLDHSVDVLIPEVIQSSEKVLVLQYMDGIRLNDTQSLEAYGVDKQKLVEEITRAYAHQIYVDGFFNGDPHPGNFLVSKEPPHRPVLLDFGLTKSLSSSMKQALAKMFLACAEGNHVGLLSAFAEMGLRLRLDMPDQAMEVSTLFFRNSTPAKDALENVKSLNDQREKNMKIIQEKMNLNQKQVKRFNPVDAFPGDAIIFTRMLNLLRGLSSTMNVRIVYLDIMRPFAEAALLGNLHNAPIMGKSWICDSPIHSDVEEKLRQFIVRIGSDKILGLQVCAYKDGKVIIDTAAGVLGRYDPRPVQPDSLFPVFSVTKGITAGLIHWLVDKDKLKLDETVARIWPEFGANGKDLIKVHHVLNHSSGLHNAMGDVIKSNPFLLCDWDHSLRHIASCTPETEPGSQQLYHYLSFGWLCGGIIEHASGKSFKEVLEEAIVHPLNIEGELYVGIPPGVEPRLATLALDIDELQKFSAIQSRPEVPDSIQQSNVSEMASSVPALFNTLNMRRAVIPAANGHCSARALARYYAALAAGGSIPPPHSSLSKPPLGSHPHFPKFPSFKLKPKSRKCSIKAANIRGNLFGSRRDTNDYNLISNISIKDVSTDTNRHMFHNSNIHDAFMGSGDFTTMVLPNGKFGLGFRRFNSNGTENMKTFGHSGMGGSTGFCNVEHDFAIAVTLNKMSVGGVTRSIIQLVCSELNIPLPDEFSAQGEKGPDMQLNLQQS
ncbi:putative aarF domain-containing protein kinase [Apostasia shenzhenica]|uniref:Putative aarF domain-containing protein kinase n=1 Tax=Apostasia shenzhenica TaxID=1088818 RepID=A0A2I0A7A6_9ASPA|nr:putative aarF domain-containing protein kinase [Apostasia shenzhenica]